MLENVWSATRIANSSVAQRSSAFARSNIAERAGCRLPCLCLVVVHLWKKVATAFGCQIKQTPQGVDQIPSAMVLIWDGWRETHLRAPIVTYLSVRFREHIKYCFVPVLAVRDAMLCTHSLGKL